ncbi:MAG: efflux transporter periplasmic adaptor subunit [Gammaproteobacteria bacterium CG11_big_fil_rev_8_21_14_0_20_46_22]|nr:MAG: efflux transporter periplasmic adaptor subunit [Gammaproteobacteria bacterium CG12_big_fil_rev_8_21_14_0_65_46_12]PIR10908.1 MAG: efflux transporter periplasmic adaptor subunit [Gammaproteobacteria bacterium CG11_big_fil_rev_8_21_14_0_20_46_22]
MIKRFIIVIILLIIIFGGVFGFDAFRSMMVKNYMAHFSPPAANITATAAKNESWQPHLYAIGSLEAYNGVDLSPKQDGVIDKIYFHSGEEVKADTPIVHQDTSVDEQELKNYEAQLLVSKENFARAKELNKKGFVSDSDYDESRATYQQAIANVDKTETIIDEKTIRAPFAGKLGIRNVNLGEYVAPGTNTVVNIQQIDPLRVLFNLPQQNLASIYVGQQIKVLRADDPDKKPFYGKITAIDSSVNTDTRNIQVQARVDNKALTLVPGMYVNVYVLMPKEDQVLTIPQTAVSYNPYGDFVYVIEKGTQEIKGKKVTGDFAKQVFITTGDMRGGQVAILKGLKAGDLVATSGQLKLQNNSPVVVTPDKGFKADKKANPAELH